MKFAILVIMFLACVNGKTLIDVSHSRRIHLPRIVGGEPANRNSTKHAVSLRIAIEEEYYGFGWGHKCGASLIAPDVLLSAAHCFFTYPYSPYEKVPRDPSEWVAILGTYNRTVIEQTTVIREIIDIVVHKGYDDNTLLNDVALLFLNESVPLDNPNIEIIELNDEIITEGTKCQAMGWGYTSYRGRLANVLLSVNISVLNLDICNSTNSYDGQLLPGMLCVGQLSGEKDSCQGDSGGPLVCNGLLTGSVSFGDECARPNFPGIYSDVLYFTEWIETQLRNRPPIENGTTDDSVVGETTETTEVNELSTSEITEVDEFTTTETTEVNELSTSEITEVDEFTTTETTEVNELSTSEITEVDEFTTTETTEVNELSTSEITEVVEFTTTVKTSSDTDSNEIATDTFIDVTSRPSTVTEGNSAHKITANIISAFLCIGMTYFKKIYF